jgi:hypothetical protein
MTKHQTVTIDQDTGEVLEGTAVAVAAPQAPAPTHIPTAASPLEALIERAVFEGANMDAVERLLGLKERVDQANAKKAFDAAIASATGEPAEGFSTIHTRRGQELEPQLRADYELLADCDVVQVGFVKRGRFGASPDGLVGADGLVEFKTHLPKILLPMLLDGEFPDEHMAQVQGQLWVTGREWVDLCAFYPGLPMFKVRTYRDETFISELEARLGRFDALVSDTVARIQAIGQPVA